MYLKSLEVQGFKSFPDKTLIRFGDDITAIVGPNGSGKSNISDAILWVMGEQSTKTLRGAKMEDVIFGGTLKRAPVGFAEATLTLDNSDRALAYDADEVMVTRRYYRSGDSEYYINRQSARLRDINEMFMDTGLGREGYSNIGQGRIDEILSLKSGDRREIFEEAAGISKYRHRKEDTERKLQHTEDNLLRIGDKVSELELQLEPLKAQSEKATQYLELKDRLRDAEVALWLESLDKLSAAAKKAEEDYASASFVLGQAHEELESLYAKAEQFSELLRSRDGDLDNARIEVSMLEGKHQQIEGQIAVIQSNKDNNRANIARIEEELKGTEDRNSGVRDQIGQTEDRIRKIDASVKEKQDSLVDLRQEQAALTANAQGLTRQFLELKDREGGLCADIAGREAKIRGIQGALETDGERIARLDEDLSSGEDRKQEAQAQLEACRKELDKAREEGKALNNTISGYTLRMERRAARRDELDRALRQKNAEADAVEAKLRVYRAMERDYESFTKSVRMVMQEAGRGNLRGIRGPVSKLIRTEDAYALAIEIALGAAVQQIVVESEQDGKAAIAYLKRTGIGRATFLPMSTVRGRRLEERGLEASPGFVGIASELVTCKPEYRPIVENLLGRIVISENLDTAIAMAKGFGNRFRIVTLDGQVMNPGGSMTGGSVNRESGILSRANELEKLTAQEERLNGEREALDQQLREAKRLTDQVEFELTTARDQLRRAEDEVLRLQGREQQQELLLSTISQALEAAQDERKTLEERTYRNTRDLEAENTQMQTLDRTLTKLREQIAGLEGSQTTAAQAVDRIAEQMSDLRSGLAALEAERASAVGHKQELEQLFRSMQGDRERRLALADNFRQENLRLEEQLRQLRQELEDNTVQVQGARQKMADAHTARADAEAEKTRTERLAQEKNKDILNMERACALLEQKKVTSNMEEKQIVDKLWDSYGLTPGTAEEFRGKVESVAAGNRKIAELRRKLGALGTPNLGAIDEYQRVNERFIYLSEQREDVLTSKRELETIIRDITKEMTTIFVEEFRKIDTYFGQVFQEMFGGGKGQLILEDPEDPLSCGIEIRVQPPGKQVKTITLLSGGEKAFVAIALYFAILKVRPTPFCMLDEIDAALDDRNVERFAGYLHNLSKKTQFIVITHRRGTMEAADILYGVTMQEQGISKLLRLDLNQMEQYLGISE